MTTNQTTDQQTQPKRQPNLIYVFADQLTYAACGYAAGDPRARTPNIDRLAAEGMSFDNAVSTYPVCAPYRASLFTGTYPTSHGMVINELRLNPNRRCLGHVLTDAGYRTSYIGKWHLFANEFGNHDDPKNSFVPRGPYRLGFDGEWKAYGFRHVYTDAYYFEETPEKRFYGEGVWEADGQTDLAIDFLNRAAADPEGRPFALFLSWGPPHEPWREDNVPPEYLEPFRDIAFPNPPNYRPEDDLPYRDNWARLSGEQRAKLEAWRRVYYAQTAWVDACLGRLRAALEASGVADDTLLVFTSDHGEMMGAQGRGAKSIFYEEACRVPLLLRWPNGGVRGARKSDACLGTVDLLPTLCGLLGLDAPEGVEGMDLSHCAQGRPGPEPEAALLQGTGAVAIWEDGHEWRALRDKRYTYAVYRLDGRERLFDNVADPYQTRDLADDPAHADTLTRFRVHLKERLAALNDAFPASTFYRDHWTDGDRNILRSATREFGPMPEAEGVTAA